MGDLNGNFPSGVVDLINHLSQRKNVRIRMDAQLSRRRLAVGTNVSVARYDQPHVSPRQAAPEISESLCPIAPRSRKPLPGGGPDETIGKKKTVESGCVEEFCHLFSPQEFIGFLPKPKISLTVTRTPCQERKNGEPELITALGNSEFNQKRSTAAAGGAERVGKPFQRLYTNCFDAHAPGQTDPVEVRTPEVK